MPVVEEAEAAKRSKRTGPPEQEPGEICGPARRPATGLSERDQRLLLISVGLEDLVELGELQEVVNLA